MLAVVSSVLVATCRVDKLVSPPVDGELVPSLTALTDSAPKASTSLRSTRIALGTSRPGRLSWRAERARNSTWLGFVQTTGNAPDTLTIQLNPAGLDTGTYRDTIVVSTNNSEARELRLPVTFSVHPCRVTAVPLDTVVTAPLNGAECGSPRATGMFARLFGFTGTAGDSVTLELQATGFDAQLVLDTTAMGTGSPLAQATACRGAAGDPCITYFRLPQTGPYVVEVTGASPTAVGTFVLNVAAPSAPALPAGPNQFQADSVTPINIGALIAAQSVVFGATVSDADAVDTLRLEVEMRRVGLAFNGTPTHTSAPVLNGAVAKVVATVGDDSSYHWRARVADQTGRRGPWMSFGGGNPETVADFTTALPQAPGAPTTLAQLRGSDQTPIPVGGINSTRSAVFRATLTDPDPGDQLRLEVELRPVGTPFTNAFTAQSAPLGSGGVAEISVSGLTDNTGYHWQARVVDQTGRASGWTSFGFNLESVADFTVAVTPSQLAFSVQPSLTTAGRVITPALQVRVLDADSNTAVSFTDSIAIGFGANPNSGTLSGRLKVKAVAGIATFDSVRIDRAGTGYMLAASATSLAPDTSIAFEVVPAPAVRLVFTGQPTNETAGRSISPNVVVTARDSMGNTATSFTGSVSITFGANPGGGPLGGITSVGAIAGVATFSDLRIRKTGTNYTLVASSGTLIAATSVQFTITPAPPVGLAFTTHPSDATAGIAINPAIVVTARDSLDNTATSFTSAVTLAIAVNPSNGTLKGTPTVSAVGGIAAFPDVRVDRSGAGYTLNATSGSFTATSSGFTITPAPPSRLTFTLPPNLATAGAPISPPVEVSVQDSLGNTTPSFADSVSIAIATNPTGGTLGGVTKVLPVAGVATFGSLSINLAGNGYALSAAAIGLSGATSPLFNVAPGGGTNLAFTTPPSTTTAGAAIPAVVVTVRDSLGNTASGFNGAVTVALGSNPAGGTLYPPSATTVTAASGIATFGNLRINRTGSYTLTATASGAVGATSAAFNITPGPAVTLVVTAQPTDAIAGTTITPVVVTARDSMANTATAFSGSVAMTIATGPGGGAILSGTPVTAVAGVASFGNLRVNRTGTYTLTATGASLNVTTAAFDIAPAPPSQLVFMVQPSAATAGAPISPAVLVAARDSMGNPTPSFGDSVTVAIGTNPPPGTGVLSGTLKAAASGGVATFGNLSINVAANNYTLTAAASGLAGATSASFNISAAVATTLEFTAQPSTTTAGVAINPHVVVRARDALGNTATGFTNVVTIAIGNNPSGGAFRPSATTSIAAVAGVATFTNLRLDKTGAGYTLTASAPDAGATSSAPFDIVPAPPLRLGFLVQPSSAVAGVAIAPAVQVAAQDSLGNITPTFSGDVTVLRQTGPAGATFLDAQETTASGVATFPTLRTTTAGSGYSLVASASGLVSSNPSSVFTVAAAAVSAAQTTVSAAPTSIGASSGSATSTITVTARDAFGNPVPGATVVLAATGSGNSLIQPVGVTNASGVATGTLSSSVAQSKTVSATVNGVGITQTATVTVTAAAAASIVVNGGNSQSATVNTAVPTDPSVLVRDQFNNPRAGVTVTFAVVSGGGSITGASQSTNASGIATVTSWTLGTAAGTNTLTATATGGGISGNPVTFTATATPAAVSASQSTVVAAPGTIVASSGAATSTITVTARDAFNNPVPGATVVLATTGSGNALTQPAAVTNASGVATGTISSTVAEAKSVIATVNAVAVTQTATVTVTPAALSAAQSTVAAAPGSIVASSGATTSTITVTARDQFSNAISGATVVLAATGAGNTLTQPAAVTNASGVTTGTISSTVAATKTVSATINALAITQTASVTVTPAAAASIAVSAGNAQSVVVSTAVATAPAVIVRDAFNNVVPGVNVTFAVASGGGTVVPTTAIATNAAGIATVTSWTLGTTAGANSLTATAAGTGISGNPLTFTATATPAAVAAAQSTVVAGSATIAACATACVAGTTASTITVTARDQFGNAIPGATVVLAATGTGNALTQPGGTTNASGVATGTISSTVAQAKTISATINGVAITQTAAVAVTATAVNAAQTTVVAAPDSIAASSGATTSTITVTARDAFNNPVSGATVVLAATGTGNTLTQPAAVTNASGVATGTISSTVAQAKTISATVNAVAVSQTATVTVTAAAVSAAQTTVVAAPTSIAAGGPTSTITVTARDAFNNPIPGATVVLAVTGTGNTVTQPAALTNASGVATGTISSNVAEVKTVSAAVNAVAITQTATVTVTSLNVSASLSTVAAAPTSIAASSGATTSTITVTARDALNNPIAGATVVLAATGTGNAVTQPAAVTNASGVATGTISSTVAASKTVSATISGTLVTQTATVTVTPAAASQLVFTTQPTNTVAGVGINPAPVVAVRDAHGNTVTSFVGNVTIGFGNNPNGGAFRPGVALTVAAASGVATFNGLRIDKVTPGYTLAATSGALNGTSAAFNVTPAPPNRLAFTTQPSQVTAGSPITPAVQVAIQDSLGNVTPTATDSVTVAIGTNPGSTTLAGTLKAAPLNGVATFGNLSIPVTGTGYTLTAAAPGRTGATSNPFNVVAGGATTLVFTTQPSNTTAGVAISPVVVTAQDGLGNTATGFTSDVTITIGNNPVGGAFRPGATLTVAAAAGVATFSNLRLDKSGNGYTLTASAAGAGATSSGAFNITPAPSLRLAFVLQPVNTVAGNAIAPAVQVAAQDSLGNTTPAFGGNVTMALDANPGGDGVLGGTLSATPVAGVASFGNLRINQADAGYTLLAGAAGLISGGSATFTITPAAPSAALSTVSAAPGTITASSGASTSTITVTARDQFNNLIPGAAVVLASTGTGNTITQPAVTNASGVTTGTISSTVAQAKTISATISGVGVTQTAAVTVNPAALSAAQSTVVAAPTTIVASSGATTSTITVTARDQFNNAISGATVVLAATGTGNTLTQPAAVTNASGVATGTISSTVAATKTVSATINALAITQTATVTVTADVAASIVVNAGNNQSATVNTAVAADPSVLVRDQFNNPRSGVAVTFAVATGGGSITGGSQSTNASGIATVASWTLGTAAGANTLTATATGSGITGNPVTFTATGNPAAVNAAQSTVAAAPGTIAASSGAATSTITVTARDQFGNAIQGATVVLASTGTGNALTQPGATTNASGVATGTISSTVAQAKTVSATINGVAITQTAAVTVTPAAVSATQTTVGTAPATIAASSGATTSTITVTARDAFNNVIQGATVVLAATGTGNTLTQPAAVTNASGVATGTISSTVAEAKTISATVSAVAITQTATVTVAPAGVGAAQSSVGAAPGTITASSGASTSTVTVTARDAFNNPIAGATVVLAATGSGNTVTQPVGTTNASGVATGTISSTAAEAKTISATINAVAVTQTAAVTVTPATVSAAQSTVGAAPGTIAVSSGGATSTITVTARDQFGNAIQGATVVLAASGSGNTITQPAGLTNAAGVATGTISSTVAEAKTISATANGVGVTQTAALTVTVGPVSAAQTTVGAAPGTIAASAGGTTSTITVTARDQFNNPISGATVVLAASGSGNTLTQPVGTTNASGVATGTLSSTVAQAKTVSATVSAVAITQTAAVTVTPAPAASIAVNAGNGQSAIVNTNVATDPAVIVRDAFNNAVSGVNVTFTVTGGGGAITPASPATIATNASGVAALTGWTLGTTAGANTMSVTSTGLSGSPVAFTATGTPAAVSAGTSTVSAAPATIAASAGGTTSTVTVTARDQFGNVIQGATVVLAATGTGNTLTQPGATTNASGVATGTLSSTVAEAKTVSATINAVAITQTAAVTVTPAAVSAALTTVAAAPGTITASSGATTSTITVTAHDAFNNPIAGAAVVLAATGTGNSITQPAVTNASGVTTGTISSTVAQAKTVSATVNAVAITQTAAVTVTAAAAASIALNAGNGQTATVNTAVATDPSVIVRDQFSNVVAGVNVTFTITGGGGSITPASPATIATNASGVAAVTAWTLGTTAGTNALTAASTGLTGTPVTFTATGTAGPATQMAIQAGNGQTATVNTAVATDPSVIVRDQFNNVVAGVNVTFTVTGGGGSTTPASPASIATNASGIAALTSWTLGSTAGVNSLSAASTGLTGSPLAFTAVGTPGPVSAATSTVSAAPGTIAASGGGTTSTITVTARDQFSNTISDVTVVLAATGTGNTVTQPVGTTNGSGVATGTISSTVAGAKTVSATINGVGITQTAVVTVTPGPVSAAQSLVSAAPGTIVASSGATTSTITVTARDAFNNPIQGATVVLATTGTGNALTQPGATTNASGVATGTISATVAEAKTVSATIGGVGVTQTATVTVTPAAVSAAQSLVSAAPGTIAASAGGTTSTITVTARDQFSNEILGATVVLAATGTGNTLTQPVGTTDAGGLATGTLSSTVAQAKTVSATINGVAITQTAAVTVTAAAAATIAVNAGNAQTATVNTAVTTDPSVVVRDAFNNVVSGVSVTFTVTGGGGSITPASPATIATNASGVAAVTDWTLGTTAGANTLSAASTGLTGTPVVFTATGTPGAVNAGQSTVSAAPASITASSGATTSTITVTARDQFANPIQGATVVLAATGTGNGLTQPAATTNGSGVATGTISSTVAEAKTVSATINGIAVTQTAGVTVAPAAVSAAQTLVSATPTTIAASSGATTSTITVTARDAFNNPIQGATVVLAASGTGNTLTQPAATTNASGVTTGTISSTVAQAKSVSATVNAVAITQTATVTVTAAAAATIAISAGNGLSATVNTDVATPPTALVTDAFGNPVSGVGVAFTVTGGGGSIAPGAPSINTNASGIAALNRWTLGTTAGANTIQAAAGGLAGSPLTFTATGTAGAATQIAIQAGNGQTASVNTAVATDPAVLVRDQFNNPVAGVNVTFTITAGGGTLSPASPAAIATNASGVAAVTSWTLGTTAGANTLQAASTGLTGSPLTFTATATAGGASAGLSTVSAAPGSIVASAGATTSTITVTARDAFNNPIQGATVVLAATGSGNTITQPVATTNAGGVATGTISSTAAEAKTVSATINAVGVTQTATVTVTPAAVSAATSTVAAAPGTIAASSGATTSTITVTARDQFSNLIQGATVVLAATGTGNTLTQPGATTNAGGVATGTISSTVAEAKTVSATINAVAITQTAAVTVTAATASAATSTVAAAPGTIAASAGGTTSTITVTARDQFSNLIQGATVVLAATGTNNTITQPAATTNGSGVTTGTISSTTAQAKTVSATINGVGVTQTATVTVTAAAAATIALNAGNGQTATVNSAVAVDPSVIVHDAFGNVVSGVSVTFTVTGGGGTISPASPATIATAANGIATLTSWTLGTTAGTNNNTLSAASTGLTGTPVAFTASATAGPVNAGQSSVSASPGVITASNGSSASTVTVTARDQFGNPVAGATVVIAATGSGNTITQPVATTTAGGVATGSFSSTVAEAKTISATANGVAITQSSLVFVVPAVPSAAQSLVSASPGTITASSGGTTTTITVTARDAFNNPIQSATVVLASTGTGNSFTLPAVTLANGTTTGTLSSTVAQGKTISATINGVGITQTAAVTVTPAAVSAAQSLVSATPGTITASNGASVSTITVTARDQFSNLIQGATVVLAATGSNNTLTQPGATTDAGGVATGSLSSTEAEDKTVSATINGVGITQTATVTVTPAAAAVLVFTQQPLAGTTVTDIAPPVTVLVRDAFGNTVTGYVGTVTMTIENDASGILGPATLTGTNPATVVNGTATFPDLRIDVLGVGYTLRATAGSLFVISAPFTIL